MASRGATLSRRAEGAPVSNRLLPHLFLVCDSDRPLSPSVRFSLDGVNSVEIGRTGQLVAGRDGPGGQRLIIGLPDAWVSTAHANLRSTPTAWVIEDNKSKNGTWINGRQQMLAPLCDGDLIELGHSFFLFREALATSVDEPTVLKSNEPRAAALGMATLVPSLAAELKKLEAIAASPVSVVLQGESGTGKEVVAIAMHRLSGRLGPFLPVNCAALPETLIESELFGSRKGAYSGADKDRPGLVRSADRGTLFLDEIAELSPSAQAALLRVLQDGEILPIGATQPIKVDVRVAAATNRDLDTLVSRGQFRADLLARISGFVAWLPPVRDRREDLGILIGTLLRRQLGDRASEVSLGCDALRELLLYDWPLNVRELEKWLAASLVLSKGQRIELEHLPVRVRPTQEIRGATANKPGSTPATQPKQKESELRKREELLGLLRAHEGNVSAVARALGKARPQVQRWLKRYGIDRDGHRS
jgi:sigma-54 dependent transcriptional regulator, acetoin dehydrogenase operon transcriptional activator AcoR